MDEMANAAMSGKPADGMATGRRWSLPPAVHILQGSRGHGRRRASQGHPRLGVNDGDDLAGASCSRRLLEAGVTEIPDRSMDIGVVGRRRQGDRRGDLLNGLNLMLERRGVGGTTGKRRSIGRRRVNGVELSGVHISEEDSRVLSLG